MLIKGVAGLYGKLRCRIVVCFIPANAREMRPGPAWHAMSLPAKHNCRRLPGHRCGSPRPRADGHHAFEHAVAEYQPVHQRGGEMHKKHAEERQGQQWWELI